MKFAILFFAANLLQAQEASSGFDLRATLSGNVNYSQDLTEAPRSGAPWAAGFRAMLYPTWKIDEHWSVTGAVQVHSRPYFQEEFTTQGYGVKADILQASLNYSRFWKHGSVLVRAGQLSSAFGSFLLRYDDADNPLISMPSEYGYYGSITPLGLAGAQVDATAGKWDARAQFVNSSPANPRALWQSDQYGNWAGGAGYTLRQGFRIGVSGYRGPYLDRKSRFYFPGEAKPKDLPATAFGADLQWGSGPWSVQAEWQAFRMNYVKIPVFHQRTGYVETRRVLTPRWYIAGRAEYLTKTYASREMVYEGVLGFRPGRHELLKFGYMRDGRHNGVSLQFVTQIHPLQFARP